MSAMEAGRERTTIWQGELEWIEKPKTDNAPEGTRHSVPCQVSAWSENGEPELKADLWPQKLSMQHIPMQLIGTIGGAYLKNSKSVMFHPQPCEALEALTRVMSSGFAGCVHFTRPGNNITEGEGGVGESTSPCDIRVLILLYHTEKRAYLAFIPNDQVAFVERLRNVIQDQKSLQAMSQQVGGERQTIWRGDLELIRMSKGKFSIQHLPCAVSALSQDGQPELNCDSWPQKLTLCWRQKSGDMEDENRLKNFKSVQFHIQPCTGLQSLTRLMSLGCVGYILLPDPATSSADFSKLIFFRYSVEKEAFLGFIPDDQAPFASLLTKLKRDIHYHRISLAIEQQNDSPSTSRQGQDVLTLEQCRTILKKLQEVCTCHVCYRALRSSDIVVCLNGHAVCSSCKAQMQHCGMCREKFSSRKPITLSQVLESMPRFCNFNEGCNRLLQENDDHESWCRYRLVKCMFCISSVECHAFFKHVVNSHGCMPLSMNDIDIPRRQFYFDVEHHAGSIKLLNGHLFNIYYCHSAAEKNLKVYVMFCPMNKVEDCTFKFNFEMRSIDDKVSIILSKEVQITADVKTDIFNISNPILETFHGKHVNFKTVISVLDTSTSPPPAKKSKAT